MLLGRCGVKPLHCRLLTPGTHPPVQGPQLSLGIVSRILALEIVQQRFGYDLGCSHELRLDLLPHGSERVGPGAPGMWTPGPLGTP